MKPEIGAAAAREGHGFDETPSAQPGGSEGGASDSQRLLHDWKRAHKRCVAYLSHLGLSEDDAILIAGDAIQRAVSRDTWEANGDAYSEALRAMREIVVEKNGEAIATKHGIDPFTA